MSKKVSMRRRAFLRGMGGLMVGLPFLESLAPRDAQAQATTAPKRFGVFFCCNGVNMERWFPTTSFGSLNAGALSGTANEALAPYVDKLLFPRGLRMAPRGYSNEFSGGDDHMKGMGCKLTAAPLDFGEDSFATGISLDYYLAERINPGVEGARRPPLNLMVGRPAGYKDLDYISYRGPGQPVLALNNPWHAYKDFMNLNNANNPDPDAVEAAERIARRRQSVLDFVSDQFSALKRGPLSKEDLVKVDKHFTVIRELEQSMTPGITQGCMIEELQARAQGFEDADVEDYDRYKEIGRLQLEIMALALACDYTRVATFHWDRGSGGPTFRWDGMSHEYNHHKLSHGTTGDNGGDDVDGYLDMLFDIDTWHQEQFAYLLQLMEGYTEEGGKTLLDSSAVLWTNELSDGKAHSYMDLPFIIAGSCQGYFKQGSYVDLDRQPHNKLLTTLANAVGVSTEWFGDQQDHSHNGTEPGEFDALKA